MTKRVTNLSRIHVTDKITSIFYCHFPLSLINLALVNTKGWQLENLDLLGFHEREFPIVKLIMLGASLDLREHIRWKREQVLYFPLLFQYLNSCTVDWTLSLLHYEMQYFLTRRKPNMDLSLDPFPFLYRHFIMETRLLRSLSKPLQWDSFCLRNDQNNQTEINVKGSKWSVYSFEE